ENSERQKPFRRPNPIAPQNSFASPVSNPPPLRHKCRLEKTGYQGCSSDYRGHHANKACGGRDFLCLDSNRNDPPQTAWLTRDRPCHCPVSSDFSIAPVAPRRNCECLFQPRRFPTAESSHLRRHSSSGSIHRAFFQRQHASNPPPNTRFPFC